MAPTLIDDMLSGLSPAHYLENIGTTPYDWQQEVLDPSAKRLILLCARQAGKSLVVGMKALSRIKYYDNSLVLLISPQQFKSRELMRKIEGLMIFDNSLPLLIKNNDFEKEFANGSRIVALPGSEQSIRGYSGPSMIIIDEASRVADGSYRGSRPMMAGADTTLILLSTPFGKRGFFHQAWEEGKYWKKILVRIAWDIKDGKHFVPGPPLKKLQAYWKQRGVSAYYSTRHTLEFLKEEYDEGGGELWIRQEYLNEFLNVGGGIFSDEDWEDAIDDNIKPMFQDEDVVDDEIDVLFGGGR